MSVTTFAAISIGSYELEMKVFEISPKTGIREIDRISHVIELGRDTYNKDKISFEMVDKLCSILYDFSYIMKGYKVKAYRACATSAIREAVNSKNVLDRVKVRTGLDIELLSNSEQRFISYKAFSMQDEIIEQAMNECTLLADIGSGSAQITLFNNGKLITTQNIRLGVLRVR
ncbi:MAG: exopolyphosphatase, partial [[Bacteroides] pectinophilus]|nr:exopolyphosphatase [[Bacteroides] pectinophilus]